VKIEAIDVMLSEKVMFCTVMVPTLWFFYAIILVLFTNFDRQAIALSIISFPVFSYIGIMTAESGMVDIKVSLLNNY